MDARKDYETKELAGKIKFTEMVLTVLERGLDRHKRTADPVTRATLLFDKLCLVTDMLCAYIENGDSTKDYPAELVTRGKNVSKVLTSELDFILDWISSPSYSPDHPFGNNVMTAAKNNYYEKAKEEQSK